MKKIIGLSALGALLFSTSVMAFDPPPWCSKDHSYPLLGTFKGKSYVALGVPVRYKADLYLPNGIYRNVYYYTSEDGYVGKDNSGFKGNAYKHVTFDQQDSIGNGKVWGEIDGECAYQNVNIHTLPTGNAISLSGGLSIRATISSSIHPLSKNVIEGNGRPTITFRYVNENWRTVETKVTSSQSINYYPRYNGPYRVSATISDGTYSKTIRIGETYYNGGIHCNTCGQIP